MSQRRILVVEDSPDVRLILTDLLQGSGYEVTSVERGEEALRQAAARPFDLMILDVLLPDMDGIQLCGMIRERGFDGGILMLTALGEVDDRVAGLSGGADDYLTKPFDSRELLARMEALLRRTHKLALTPVAHYKFGEVEVDFENRTVTRAGETVALAAREWQLLRHLVNHRGQAISREELLANVWADQRYIGPRTVDTHVAWLRQKLEPEPQSPRYILTLRGAGYKFAP